jgi:hypothetical protein
MIKPPKNKYLSNVFDKMIERHVNICQRVSIPVNGSKQLSAHVVEGSCLENKEKMFLANLKMINVDTICIMIFIIMQRFSRLRSIFNMENISLWSNGGKC